MDIDTEIRLKKDLQASAITHKSLVEQAKAQMLSAENYLIDVVEESYKQCGNVSFIADALNTNRQRVYLLLASRGIRPGKETVNAS